MIVFIYNRTWKMNVDLEYVCENAGKRDFWIDEHYHKHPYVPFTMNQAKKILKLVYKNTLDDEEMQEDIKSYLSKYPKMIKIWEGLK